MCVGLEKDKLSNDDYECYRRHNCLKATLHPKHFVPKNHAPPKLSEQNKWHVKEVFLLFTSQSGVQFGLQAYYHQEELARKKKEFKEQNKGRDLHSQLRV
jgi:hypothetical protein